MSDLLHKLQKPPQTPKMSDRTRDTDNSDTTSFNSSPRYTAASSTAATSITASSDASDFPETYSKSSAAARTPRKSSVTISRSSRTGASSAGGASRPIDVPRSQSPLSKFIHQAEKMRPLVDNDPSEFSQSPGLKDSPASQARVSSRQRPVSSRQASTKQYPPNSFRSDDFDATPTKQSAPGSSLHAWDQDLRRARTGAAFDPTMHRNASISKRPNTTSRSSSISQPADSDTVPVERGRSSTRTDDVAEGENWAGHSVPTTRRRRRSSLQRIEDATNRFIDGILDSTDKVRQSIARSISRSSSRRQRRMSELESEELAPTPPTVSPPEPTEPKPISKPSTSNGLPSAEEVYSKRTYFTKCSHSSPPAHAPLNESHRSVTLTSSLLRFPTADHREYLAALAQNPNLPPKEVSVLSGRCAACDLQNRRTQETEWLRIWNAKQDIFAARLREIKSKGDKTGADQQLILALEYKLGELRAAQDRDIFAIWVDFRARWGVSPVGIVEEGDDERESWNANANPPYPIEAESGPSTYARPKMRSRPASSSATSTATTGTTGTGFMRNGRHGGPMDDVREPGRMRLSWTRPANGDGVLPLPRLPKGYMMGQGTEWTDEEKRLLGA